MTRFKGWRTVAFNILSAALPILQLTELINVLPTEWLPWYMLAVAVGNVFLRSITTTPIGRSK